MPLAEILSTVRNLASSSSKTSSEFKNEAVKNNKNIDSAIKDISKMFQSQMAENSKSKSSNKVILDTIRSNSKLTDENNVLLKQSISLQNDMMDQLKQISSSVSGLMQQLSGTEDGKKSSPLDKALESSSSLAMMAGLLAAGAAGSAFLNLPQGEEQTQGDDVFGGGGGGGGGGGNVANTDLPQEAQAFLNTLTAPGYEGTSSYPNSGYNTIVGGDQFEGYKSHPGIVGVVTSAGDSTAAGRYQITNTTWKELSKKYNLTDFSPENQDLAAWLLAQERYTKITKRNLLEDLKSNDPKVLAGVEQALSGTWSSLKGGVHQGSSAGSFSNFYSQNLQTLNDPNQQDQNNVETTSENGVIPTSSSTGGSAGVVPETPAGGSAGVVPETPAMNGGELQNFSLKDPSHVQGLDSNFQENLLKFFSAAKEKGHDIKLYSGYRSNERQAELFRDAVAKYGSEEAARKYVAPPGKSKHNHGLAADLKYSSDAAKKWAHQNASDFGLHFRMKHEDWHIEPINAAASSQNNNTESKLNSGEGYSSTNSGVVSQNAPEMLSSLFGSLSGSISDNLSGASDVLSGGFGMNFGGISAENITSNLGQLNVGEQIESITSSINNLLPSNLNDIISQIQTSISESIIPIVNKPAPSEGVESRLATSSNSDQTTTRASWWRLFLSPDEKVKGILNRSV
jgi:muramidase (phage lysozyme)